MPQTYYSFHLFEPKSFISFSFKLRNNRLAELPTLGLNKQTQLRHLLLENNQLKYLPNELAELRNLAALNITDNPIEYPPSDVVSKGLKFVQAFMRAHLYAQHPEAELSNSDGAPYPTYSVKKSFDNEFNDDVWATSDEDEPKTPSKSMYNIQRSKSATRFASKTIQDSGLPISYLRK